MKNKQTNLPPYEPAFASSNGVHSPDKKGDETASNPGAQIHFIHIPELRLPNSEGYSGPTSVIERTWLQNLKALCSKHIKVLPDQKVCLIGSIEPTSVLSIGALAVHFLGNLSEVGAVSMYRQLSVNAGAGYPAVEYTSEQMRIVLEDTDHVILPLGTNAFFGMLDMAHHFYCKIKENPKVRKKKIALTQLNGFPKEEKETAIMVTFFPKKKKYTVKAKTLTT
ncbi:MAG: hypothetical protein QG568_577 [Patescibacteria group bacterium]|nr:hypothetical protein [Patescibacteria group bacterium]